MDDRKRKSLIYILIGVVFTLISLLFIVNAVIDSGSIIVVIVTLVIGVSFFFYGKHSYKKAKKATEFREWHD